MATSEQPQTENASNIKDIPQERWYIMDDETKQPMGPYSRWIIVSRFNNKQIEKETLLWLDGTPSGWKQLCEFGELKDVLPNGVINDNAIIEFDINNEINLRDSKNNLKLTKDNLENKLWYYKNEWSKIIGPIPLSEVFYKLETNVIGRNTEIQEENSQLWRRVEDVQKQFAKEWHENEKSNGNENGNNDNDNDNDNGNDNEAEEEDFDLGLSKNPDFFNPDTRYLAELEHQFQKEEKQLTNNDNNNNNNNTKNENDKNPNEKKKDNDNKNNSNNDETRKNENSNDANEDTNGVDSSKADNNNNKVSGKRKRNNKNKHKHKDKTAIYISGLPLDIDTSELFEYFHEAGIIKKNGLTGEMMIKIYHNHETMKPKGDALITFLKQESVKIAIDRFDDSEIRPNHTIRVKAATFEQQASNHNTNNNNDTNNNSNSNDDVPPKKRQRMNNDNSNKNSSSNNNRGLTTTQKDILSKMNNQESLLSWDDDDNSQVPQLSIVILKNMFDINDIYNEPYNGNEYLFYQNLKKEVIDECVKKIGKIEKCDIYQGSRKGVIKIKFEYPKHAAECIKIMNRRYFDGRIIECSYWDGTDYTVRESMEQQEQRLKQFQKQIEE